MLTKVVSGVQAGVDRAGLDAAREVGIPIGGWYPKGRLAERGRTERTTGHLYRCREYE
jgi:hypothetical protein